MSINENIAFLLFSVNVDQNDVDPSTLKLCIFRTRTNFYTANTDSESASDKLSTGVFFARVGGGHFRPPLEGGVPGPKNLACFKQQKLGLLHVEGHATLAHDDAPASAGAPAPMEAEADT